MSHNNHRESRIGNRESNIQYRESSYLRAYKALYLRAYKAPLHLSRTLYKSPLFMQNKPNFQDARMNVNIYNTTYYKNFIPLAGYKNKPNSNPIKPNCRKGKIDAKCVFTKDYRKNGDFLVRINKPNLVKGPK